MISALECYRSKRGFQHQILQAHRHLGSVSKEIQMAIGRIHAQEKLDKKLKKKLRAYEKDLYTRFIEDYVTFSSVHKCSTLENDEREFQMSVAMPMCVELCRINFILAVSKLSKEMEELFNKPRPENAQDYNVLYCFQDMTKHYDVPMLSFNQEQFMHAVWTASEMLLTLRQDQVGYFRRIVYLLWIRAGQLFSTWHNEQTLNLDDMRQAHPKKENHFICNRNFMFFCTIYFNALSRPLYYHDAFEHLFSTKIDDESSILVENVRNWLHDCVCASIGEDTGDAFVDLYNDTRVLAYEFPGDDEWFKFRHPNQAINTRTRGQVIDAIRPHYRDTFYTDHQLGLKHIFAALDRCNDENNHQTHVSRKFLLYGALNHYFKLNFPSIFNDENNFTDTFVIRNQDIERHSTPLSHDWYPVMIELLSGAVWVFFHGNVWPTEDVCVAIGIWFWIIKKYKNGKLHDKRVDLNNMIQEIEQRKGDEEDEEDGVEECIILY